jgi:hypothetical protein
LRGDGHKMVQSISVQVADAAKVEASLGTEFKLVAETVISTKLGT